MGATWVDPEERRRARWAEKLRSMRTSERELCILRAAVRTGSIRTSQERVAEQLDLCAATLHHFVRGRMPRPKTHLASR